MSESRWWCIKNGRSGNQKDHPNSVETIHMSSEGRLLSHESCDMTVDIPLLLDRLLSPFWPSNLNLSNKPVLILQFEFQPGISRTVLFPLFPDRPLWVYYFSWNDCWAWHDVRWNIKKQKMKRYSVILGRNEHQKIEWLWSWLDSALFFKFFMVFKCIFIFGIFLQKFWKLKNCRNSRYL